MNITVWNEKSPEEQKGAERKAYPKGMQETIGSIFPKEEFTVTESWQNLLDDGLSEDLLTKTDVLIYWAHSKHDELKDETARRIFDFASRGMGVIFLHSAHFSKPFKKIMGTTGSLSWREDGRHERLYTVSPSHPIADGLPESFTLKKEEMYCEYFDIPKPDEIVFIGWYPGGEIFRSGFTYHVGEGRVFYFQPGHETYPIYHDENIRKVIYNAALWAGKQEKPVNKTFISDTCHFVVPKTLNVTLKYKR